MLVLDKRSSLSIISLRRDQSTLDLHRRRVAEKRSGDNILYIVDDACLLQPRRGTSCEQSSISCLVAALQGSVDWNVVQAEPSIASSPFELLSAINSPCMFRAAEMLAYRRITTIWDHYRWRMIAIACLCETYSLRRNVVKQA